MNQPEQNRTPDARRTHRGGLASPALTEAALTEALERAPAITIPSDFATRIAARLPEEGRKARSAWTGCGPRIALGCGVLLTLALFAFAPHTTPSFYDLRFDMELLLLVELGSVAYLATRPLTRD